jgi:predicted RNA-binding protein with TRAM domain
MVFDQGKCWLRKGRRVILRPEALLALVTLAAGRRIVEGAGAPTLTSFLAAPGRCDATGRVGGALRGGQLCRSARGGAGRVLAARRSDGGKRSGRARKPDSGGASDNQHRAAAAHGVKRGDALTVDVASLAGGTGKGAGCGVARKDGLIIFIEGALPGSRVEVTVTGVKTEYIEARIRDVIHPSPDAVASPCAHFRSQGSGCGGCRLLGMSYEGQLREKQAQVDQVFGGWAQNGTAVRRIIGADPSERTNHRNRLDFAFAASQWIPPAEGGSAFGGVRERAAEPQRATGASSGGDASVRTMFVGFRPSGVSDAVVDVGIERAYPPSVCAPHALRTNLGR